MPSFQSLLRPAMKDNIRPCNAALCCDPQSLPAAVPALQPAHVPFSSQHAARQNKAWACCAHRISATILHTLASTDWTMSAKRLPSVDVCRHRCNFVYSYVTLLHLHFSTCT